MQQTPRMRLLAPAKINLHLRGGPLQDDGFHPLLTWMVTVGLFDTLTIEADDGVVADRTVVDRAVGGLAFVDHVAADSAARNSLAPAVQFTCDDDSLPTDERNLVV